MAGLQYIFSSQEKKKISTEKNTAEVSKFEKTTVRGKCDQVCMFLLNSHSFNLGIVGCAAGGIFFEYRNLVLSFWKTLHYSLFWNGQLRLLQSASSRKKSHHSIILISLTSVLNCCVWNVFYLTSIFPEATLRPGGLRKK